MNRLAEQKSPYLIQHRHNPVNWYPWGEEAFEHAVAENKPIFLSIGYSTCYWCHVMEKESFEHDDVAKVLNDHFISIKVDREERPDVDSIYMNAVIAISGHGGWPLSVFLTPKLKPFFGATYFPRENFITLLENINEHWRREPQAILPVADRLADVIASEMRSVETGATERELCDASYAELNRSFDEKFGGFGRAPKFPPSGSIRLLLRIDARSSSGGGRAREMACFTLEKMARGGLYDHLGGGFHRYSVDNEWLVSHFEKMLYDNAQLAAAYLEGYQVSGNEMFASVARGTLDYVLRDMTHELGGFYSAEDAGEVGKEGEFYVWQEAELREALSAEEFESFSALYGVSAGGNFEHGANVLSLQPAFSWEAKSEATAANAIEKILALRALRKRPHLDDKIITSWNALMIGALATAYRTLGDDRYLAAAQKAANFIQSHLLRDGMLLRRYSGGEAGIAGFLDDYAFFIQALIDLYQADFDERWIRMAIDLQKKTDELFWDESGSAYFFAAAADASLIARRKEFFDGAEPSGNSVALHNILRLADFTLDRKYLARAGKLADSAGAAAQNYPSGFSALLCAFEYKLGAAKEIAIVPREAGKETRQLLDLLHRVFLPHKVVAVGNPAAVDDESALGIFRGREMKNCKTTFYICEAGACRLPTNDATEAFELIRGK